MAINPVEHDTKTAELFGELAKAQAKVRTAVERLHRSVGDKKVDRFTRRERWALTLAETIAKAETMTEPLLSSDASPATALQIYTSAGVAVVNLETEIADMEDTYREHRWSRFILCVSSNGHIHNYHRCHTLYATSIVEWHPELSGQSEAEAVKALGPILCTHCYPSAPVEYKRDPAEVKREREAPAKAAEKAARQAAKAAKNLLPNQQFKSHHGDHVTTVAAAKQALRDERELNYYYGRGPHPWHPESVQAAETAKQVLLAREADQPGTGATQAEIDKIIATADKKHRKEAGLS